MPETIYIPSTERPHGPTEPRAALAANREVRVEWKGGDVLERFG